ncbi:protein kinase [Streptosporangiaceae bacterium NEAU-GS5]|nr:protein kinase [Streptosporangiaceae bacterium NEAU-GS5]
MHRQVLQQAHNQATAILADARTEAEQIIATAKLQRARILDPLLHPPWPAPIMILNDRWRLHAPLHADSSAMAALYKAHELADPATVVVAKVFHQAHSDPQRLRAFLREVRGIRLRHPNIGQIIDSGQDFTSQALYLISPLYQPGSLNLHLQQPSAACLPLGWKLWVVDQVLAGLQAAAVSNIIHLDIKPQNIVLDGPANVRIIDWGMSQLHEDGRSVSTVLPGGTKWFASPEQLGGTATAPSSLSDLYGVGALAYWLLTGAEPLRREIETDPETANEAISGILQVRRLMEAGVRPERADRLSPGVSEQLGRLVDQWLSYAPADRAPPRLAPSAALGWARRRLDSHISRAALHPSWQGRGYLRTG